MLNLTNYSDKELSDHVFNDQYFWNERHDMAYLFDLINEEFVTTKAQRATLIGDLTEYAHEMAEV